MKVQSNAVPKALIRAVAFFTRISLFLNFFLVIFWDIFGIPSLFFSRCKNQVKGRFGKQDTNGYIPYFLPITNGLLKEKKNSNAQFLINAQFTVFENVTQKVSFKMASEASYVYLLSGQKLIKNAKKMIHLGEFLKTCGL